ncbi:TetR family transcriptional regulator [Actinomycetospora endophytica]|uniref:TetR family transcriptional regulator n=1 Tax=Actinomycetospora endophytica TaxID=2291215 RepID=A0ABS8P9U7_9PSEU|nr:TetR family transcriptional regulator [Actinomycetospora endophytica]MCD2194884.1 TetR family transcriptional regulator [Actinomycetospora endophytica]
MPARTSETKDRRTFTETARREQIVRAAVDTLAELGYSDTSLGKIARTAGLSSVGMISYYFSGKSELMSEVVSTVLTAAGEIVAPRVAAQETAVGRFRTYIEASLEHLADRRAEAVALIEITLGARDRERSDELEAGATEVVTDLVARAQAELDAARESTGEPAREPLDPHVVAVAVRGAINSAVGRSFRRRPGSEADPELAAEGAPIAELFVRGL